MAAPSDVAPCGRSGQAMSALCHERSEVQSVFDEFKTPPPANSTVSRSRTPALVLQERWGLLVAHFTHAVCGIIGR